jgi:hypothetical protein
MPNDMDLNEPLGVVAVTAPTEAQMIEELLRNNSIPCSLQGNVQSNPLPATSDLDDVRILVRESDLAGAKELVRAYFEGGGEDQEGQGGS